MDITQCATTSVLHMIITKLQQRTHLEHIGSLVGLFRQLCHIILKFELCSQYHLDSKSNVIKLSFSEKLSFLNEGALHYHHRLSHWKRLAMTLFHTLLSISQVSLKVKTDIWCYGPLANEHYNQCYYCWKVRDNSDSELVATSRDPYCILETVLVLAAIEGCWFRKSKKY